MNSSNPFFKNKSFKDSSVTTYDGTENKSVVIDYNDTMSVSGTINKSFALLFLLIASAFVTWYLTFQGYNTMILTIGGDCWINFSCFSFKPQLSRYLAPGYAVFEGLFLGGISAF